jgi:hypothetical protein
MAPSQSEIKAQRLAALFVVQKWSAILTHEEARQMPTVRHVTVLLVWLLPMCVRLVVGLSRRCRPSSALSAGKGIGRRLDTVPDDLLIH